jgi:DinB superfamily
MHTSPAPQLAAPGAGLPTIELVIARLLFRLKRATGNEAAFRAAYLQERERIHSLVAPLDRTTAEARVLIKRLPGLEDSSRYWSVGMTLDHLRIVNQAITQIVSALYLGIVPPGRASTAEVKPDPSVGPEVVTDYEASCDAWLATLDKAPSIPSTTRFPHPWFGPLDAKGWTALQALHLAIHRRQIEQILRAQA